MNVINLIVSMLICYNIKQVKSVWIEYAVNSCYIGESGPISTDGKGYKGADFFFFAELKVVLCNKIIILYFLRLVRFVNKWKIQR